LEEVFVSRDDYHVQALRGVTLGQGSYDIVCLQPFLLQYRATEGPGNFLDVRNLGDEGLGDGFARGLVVGVGFVPEGGAFDIETDGYVLGIGFLEQLKQHEGKAVNGIGWKTLGVRKRRDGVEGPEKVVVPIYQIDRFHLLYLEAGVDFEPLRGLHGYDIFHAGFLF